MNTCPVCKIGTIRTRGPRDFQYQQCDNAECGALVGVRWLEGEEKARADADNAAKRERKKRPTQKQLLEEYRAERARLEALPQLPVEGWSAREWFAGYDDATPRQMEMDL